MKSFQDLKLNNYLFLIFYVINNRYRHVSIYILQRIMIACKHSFKFQQQALMSVLKVIVQFGVYIYELPVSSSLMTNENSKG